MGMGLWILRRTVCVTSHAARVATITIQDKARLPPIMPQHVRHGDSERHRKDSVPLKRMTTYEEVSAFVQMLAGEAAGFMTGQTRPFDGGKVMA